MEAIKEFVFNFKRREIARRSLDLLLKALVLRWLGV